MNPRSSIRSRALGPGALLLALLAGTVGAQQPTGYQDITDADFKKLAPGAAPTGQKLSIGFLKFDRLGVIGNTNVLRLYRSQIEDGRLVVRDPRLVQSLIGNRDSDNNTLTQNISNIQVFGTTEPQRSPPLMLLVVTRVVRQPSDAERFQAQLAQLGDDLARHEALLRTVEQYAAFFAAERDQLQPIADRLRARIREIKFAQLPALPGGAAAWIQVGTEYRDLPTLAAVYDHPDVPQAQKDAAAAALHTPEINAQRYLGRWYSNDELRRLIGFVRTERGSWVTAERMELLAVCDATRARISRGQTVIVETPFNLEDAARQGQVVPGMTKAQIMTATLVQRAEPYPVHADRMREPYGAGEIVWDQWIMRDGTRLYFFNGRWFRP